MDSQGYQNDIDALAACGPLKAWSVIVTIMGDLCRSPEDSISGPILSLLVSRLGISNQALRVALHRLRRDGWIRTEKEGRTSHHFISEHGWEKTRSVRSIVYPKDIPENIPVYFVLAPPSVAAPDFSELMPDDSILLSPREAIVPDSADGLPEDFLVFSFCPSDLPVWLENLVAPCELRLDYSRLANLLEAILEKKVPLGIDEATVLRLIVLHQWRRLRLRHGPLPDLLLSSDWEGARARRLVGRAIITFEVPRISTLGRQNKTAG